MRKTKLGDSVDVLAVECCKLYSQEEQDAFLATLPVKSRTYYKGKKAGQKREVFDIDGRVFNKLWSKLEGYAISASSRSHHYKDRDIIEDTVSEIKYLLVRVLRFFGPRPFGQRLSSSFKLIVNNVLTNTFNRNTVPNPAYVKNVNALSSDSFISTLERIYIDYLSLDKFLSDDDDSITLHDVIHKSEMLGFEEVESSEFVEEMTSEIQAAVGKLLQGYTVRETANIVGYSTVISCKRDLVRGLLRHPGFAERAQQACIILKIADVDSFELNAEIQKGNIMDKPNAGSSTQQNLVLASDAEIGKLYMIGNKPIIIVDKGEFNVTAKADFLGTNPVTISAGTQLSMYDETKIIKSTHRSNNMSENTQENTSVAALKAAKPQPRSKVIDAHLAAGTENFDAIATAVIAAGCAVEAERKSVISQAKTRYKWYKTGKKVNPFAQAAKVASDSSQQPE